MRLLSDLVAKLDDSEMDRIIHHLEAYDPKGANYLKVKLCKADVYHYSSYSESSRDGNINVRYTCHMCGKITSGQFNLP